MHNSIRSIALDLHGVLFRLDWFHIIKLWWHYHHKFRLILCAVDPRMIWYGIKVLLSDPTDEECYAVFECYWPILVPFIIACTNAQKPMPEMVVLMKELKAKGYQLHMVSNCGPRRLAFTKEQFSEIVSLFDCIYCSNGDVTNVIKKPQQLFFDNYKAHCCVKPQEVLFIDDSKKNVSAALKAGFNAVRFKNHHQLRTALIARGIDLL